ncbi:uncharacterized protein I303_101403 [Kwoniella dejecticola CBS 10117]|uniref:Beta-glucuronidase C-terminal domain-containing protein n=1 Tax=Kwoniella dejecticola CBS 10117 TaxID=1296121 RepID=A0A1A6AHU1_9TREE|nr:uncharacterized protein I303_01412 [Kwoniella dejecticola CBS 10117]OBR89583.1 hypothetical protein I303_01412 [Kwoniella dejecticola CBS 10117]
MSSLFTTLSLVSLTLTSAQSLTVYTGGTAATTTTDTASAASGTYTGLAAYDPTVLTPPPAPATPVTSYTLNLPANGQAVLDAGMALSIPQKGNFLGFSVELSIANSLMGSSSTNMKVPFLNYMANIQNRAGVGPIIRVGGNSQEGSSLFVDGLQDGAVLDKIKVSEGVTDTPLINYSLELFYLMANVTSLVGADWYFGLSFNESAVDSPTGNVPIAAKWAQDILGDSLLALSVGNEPDLYVDHSKRESGWGVSNYVSEFDSMTQSILADNNLIDTTAFIGPSTCCQVVGFELDDVLNAGWLTDNVNNLAAVSVQHYPTNNCKINGNVINPQDIFADFLNHTSAQAQVSPYLGNAATVQGVQREFVMLETNTASCGGFAGLSDSFGVALWMTDYALQMAWGNFSTALMHVGGQNVYYNPFTPPPSTEASTKQWTTGSIYYSTLVIAEAFGKSNQSKVVDISPTTDQDANNIYHPIYAVYENDAPTRVVLFNYIDDNTGANDLQTTITVGSDVTSVSVRYLRASSVSEQYAITWANQTLGTSFASDGRLYGSQETVTITCENGNCVIPVPAPSIALVFLTSDALTNSSPSEESKTAYETSVIGTGSATVDKQALETSNGQSSNKTGGGTSKGNTASSANPVWNVQPIGISLLAVILGALMSTLL